jgi:mono/diheme cytochrome c family protein
VDQKNGFWRRLFAGLSAFLEHPIQVTRGTLIFLWRVVPAWIYLRFRGFGGWIARLPRSRGVHVFLALCLLICIVYSALFYWIEQQVPKPEPVDQYVYMDQGWGYSGTSPDRIRFYYSPQGALVRNIRYDWFVNLERPWKKDQFADSVYMRGYGFIVDPSQTDRNPDNLPIGFARQWDSRSASMMLDLTCAACHTGELQVVKDNKRIAVRIDGGQSMQAVTSTKLGSFGTDVLFALSATAINPAKWTRFANRVLGEDHTLLNAWHLWTDMINVIYGMAHQAAIENRLHLYPVEEGFGRTDALGRIANNVFATNLDPKNYRVANAPVSYPAIWNTWKFDWVQYTASVAQPLARNIGESLGTGAQYYLLDRYGNPVEESQRYHSSTDVPQLLHIENTLQKLTPPVWNEDLFGKKDQDKYDEGKKLFHAICQRCHGPFYASCAEKQIEAPLKDSTADHWKITTLPIQDIGTDPTAATNFVNDRYDLSSTGIEVSDLRKILDVYYRIRYRRITKYGGNAEDQESIAHRTEDQYAQEQLSGIDLSHVSSGAGLSYIIALIRQRAYEDMNIKDDLYRREVVDGFGQLDIPQVIASYRAKPLEGIWATAPFLHNGSVPTLYEMLLPANQRSTKFYLKGRTFDPVKVGLITNPTDPAAFLYDTTIPGNSNSGHEFRAGYRPYKEGDPPSWGVIGPELTEDQRWSIIEYLKFMKDDDFAETPEPCPASTKENELSILNQMSIPTEGPPPALRSAVHAGGPK